MPTSYQLRQQEQHEQKLRDMREQVAAGKLVIRQDDAGGAQAVPATGLRRAKRRGEAALMGGFFIPPEGGGVRPPSGPTDELRDHAEARTGAISRDRRIEGLMCRRSGRDCVLRVGELDDGNGRTVVAIIQVGRGTFTVHHLQAEPGAAAEPLVLTQSDVYAVTDFE